MNNTTNLQIPPEENEKLFQLFKEANLEVKNITVYDQEIQGDNISLLLENNTGATLTEILIPLDVLSFWVNSSEENKTSHTDYNYGLGYIEETIDFFEPPLQWWPKASAYQQQHILKTMLKSLFCSSLHLAGKERKAA